MPLIFGPRQPHLLVDALLEEFGRHSNDLNRAIDARDEMLLFSLARGEGWDQTIAEYFLAGLEVVTCLRRIAEAHFGGLASVGRMLDFASGFGRVTRHLVQEIDPSKIWVSDLVAEAVGFQVRQFRVQGVLSSTNPGQFTIDERFDLIYVGSLFTHLPPDQFRAWIEQLLKHLAPDGLLAFSVHDQSLFGGELSEEGSLFFHTSESEQLDPAHYGTTWVSEDFVRRALESAGGLKSCTRLAHAISESQDLYVVTARQNPSVSHLDLGTGLRGYLENCTREGDRLLLSGWAAQLSARYRVKRVEVRLGTTTVAATSPFAARPDVAGHLRDPAAADSGWGTSFELPPGSSLSGEVMFVKVVSESGTERFLFVGTPQTAIAQTGRRAGIRFAGREELVGEVERLETELRAATAAMQKSHADVRLLKWKLHRSPMFWLRTAAGGARRFLRERSGRGLARK